MPRIMFCEATRWRSIPGIARVRAEHRVASALGLDGRLVVEIVCDGVERTLLPDESVRIPVGARHRISNPGPDPLDLIEVQVGDYLGEDDIIRFEDDFGRIPKQSR